jgi:hypothetical protein
VSGSTHAERKSCRSLPGLGCGRSNTRSVHRTASRKTLYAYLDTELIAVLAVVAVDSALDMLCDRGRSRSDKHAEREDEGRGELHVVV